MVTFASCSIVPCGWVTDEFLFPHQLRRAAANLLRIERAVAVDPERTMDFPRGVHASIRQFRFLYKNSINIDIYLCIITYSYKHMYIHSIYMITSEKLI
jgi:hypothetical protein